VVINIHLEFVVNVGMHLAVALLALGIFSVAVVCWSGKMETEHGRKS
jgi:hypothetical protein